MMKIKFEIVFFVMTVLVFGCGKDSAVKSENIQSNRVDTAPPTISRKLKFINIGSAEDFALLAYSNIQSIPNSYINGKTGLMPGTRDQILIKPNEVVGGASEIIGSDDETTPFNLLSNAKVDMVSAYKQLANITPDNDKKNIYDGLSIGKVVTPGCYKWYGDLVIGNNFTLEGSDNDVWIFQISSNLLVKTGVHLFLKGGAKARNIFWQIGGSAVLEKDTEMAGTMIAQQSIELKNHSVLYGRAFVKNGFINLDQAFIYRP